MDVKLKYIAAIAILLLASVIQPRAMSAESNGKQLRFGIGMALLANEKCEGFKLGPKFEQLMVIIRMGAKNSGETLDEKLLFERSKKEATETLKKANKDLCEAANKVAANDGVISRK